MPKIILEAVVGSTVHGTAVNDGLEDLDLMAVMIEDQKDFIGFNPKDVKVQRSKPQGVRSEAGDVDYVAYGLRKFLSLALRGNPSILVALFAPPSHINVLTEEGHDLRNLRSAIVSKAAYQPFRGYMRQQRQRLAGTLGQKNCTRPELVEAYGFDTKYAGHILRLGMQGKELLEDGVITLPMPQAQRDMVIDVRTGKYTLEQVEAMFEVAEVQLDNAYAYSELREQPDVQRVEEWMCRKYVNYWKGN